MLIAQNKMIEERLERNYDIANPHVRYENEKEWGISFYPKLSLSKTAPILKYLVSIDKKTGSIIYFGQGK